MFRSLYLFVLLFLTGLWNAPVQAACAGPLVGDRPDFTESAETVINCLVQLEIGYTLSRDRDSDEHSIGEILARVRLTDSAELRVGFNSYLLTRRETGNDLSGLDDSAIGFKLRLPPAWFNSIPPPIRPMAAVIIESSLPTGGVDYKTDAFQPVAKLALAWELSDKAELASNINFAYSGEGSERFGQLGGSLALGLDATEKIGWYVEVFSFRPGSREGDTDSYFNAGTTYLVHDCLQLDARLGAGISGDASGFFAGIGIIHRW